MTTRDMKEFLTSIGFTITIYSWCVL